MNQQFALDRSNAKWMGVCSGISNLTGIDATGVRIIAVLATILLLGPIALLLYLVTGLVAPSA
jgi:phage shock protein C